MGTFASQLSAAQRQLDSECDCCDHGPREPAPPMEAMPYADTVREWAGVEPRREIDRLAFVTGWYEGAPF